ncbi:MAG: DNA-binding response regulator, partial [Aquificota bacterium]
MRVLLVEDDQHIGTMLVEGLSHEGFYVDWVKDGYSAINSILEKDYDLVLLDIMLPKMDGLRVCKRIREIRDIPIIMLTAKGQ